MKDRGIKRDQISLNVIWYSYVFGIRRVLGSAVRCRWGTWPFCTFCKLCFAIELQQVHQWEVEDVVVAWPNLSFAVLLSFSLFPAKSKIESMTGSNMQVYFGGGLLSANVHKEFRRICIILQQVYQAPSVSRIIVHHGAQISSITQCEFKDVKGTAWPEICCPQRPGVIRE